MLKCLNAKMKQRSFTIIELLVVISIISILSGILLINYRSGQKDLALQRAASKLAQDIRRTQEMATSAKECIDLAPPAGACPIGGGPPQGYGMYFIMGFPLSYFIFSDTNGNRFFDGGEEIEGIYMEANIKLDALSGDPLQIIFSSPDPAVTICQGADCTITSGWIRIKNDGKTRTITINKVGQISTD